MPFLFLLGLQIRYLDRHASQNVVPGAVDARYDEKLPPNPRILLSLVAVNLTAVMSTIRDASLNALKAASNAVSQVNIPGKLPVIAETSKEFAVQYLAKPTAQGAQWASAEGTKLAGWAAANPVTTAAGAAGLLIIAAPALAAAPVLSAVGFGANGIVAGMCLLLQALCKLHVSVANVVPI